jgi:hypothetical protein
MSHIYWTKWLPLMLTQNEELPEEELSSQPHSRLNVMSLTQIEVGFHRCSQSHIVGLVWASSMLNPQSSNLDRALKPFLCRDRLSAKLDQ